MSVGIERMNRRCSPYIQWIITHHGKERNNAIYGSSMDEIQRLSLKYDLDKYHIYHLYVESLNITRNTYKSETDLPDFKYKYMVNKGQRWGRGLRV